MKASVLFEPGKPLSVEELDLEPPRAGEVSVRMAASGVCHSCLHAADGSWKGVPVPIVLSDEGAGVVEQVGPGVDLKVSDHVILSWAPTCGRCHYCMIGRPNLCERRQPGKGVLPDGTTRMSLRGKPVYHYGHVATYASRTVVHESCAIPIDKNVPLDKAALIGCSVMTGVGAVINTAAVPAGASMAVSAWAVSGRSVWDSAVPFYGPGAVHERNVPDQQRGDSLCLMYWSRHAAVGSERSEPHSSTPSARRRWKRCASLIIHWCCDWSNIRWSASLSRTRRRNSTPTS
jgi:Zn-dependent alcohol dehydrogenase